MFYLPVLFFNRIYVIAFYSIVIVFSYSSLLTYLLT